MRLRFSAGAPRITKAPKKIALTYDEVKTTKPHAKALRLVGIEPVLLSAENEWSLEGLDGLLLTGGRDLDPRRYGQEPAPETEKPNPSRDRMGIGLLGEALDR